MSKILDVILPTPCIICSVIGSPFCKACFSSFQTSQLTFEISSVKGFAVTRYSEQPARIINAVKESGITSLVLFMGQLMATNWPTALKEPLLVPVPSSPTNMRKRGFSHTLLLAKAIAKNMPDSKVRPLLRSARRRTDQVGLSASQRVANLSAAFAVDLRGFHPQGGPIVVIDDVSTTGATLAAAISTLTQAGLCVSGFAVFARSGS